MSEPVRAESPLVEIDMDRWAIDAGELTAVLLGERRFCGHYNLRGDVADSTFTQAVSDCLGVTLPATNMTDSAGECTALGLGPNEWLIVSVNDDESRLAELKAALAGHFANVVRLSSGQTLITVGGERAADLLAKGTPLDLHVQAFPVGRCAQTVLAKAGVLIHRVNVNAFDVVVRRSFADYLWQWLEDAALEFHDHSDRSEHGSGAAVPLPPNVNDVSHEQA